MDQPSQTLRGELEATLRSWLDRVPPILLLAAPALILVPIVATLPEQLRLGFSIDMEIYRRYASQLLAGAVAYRDVPIEYPPLALVPMVLPLLGEPSPASIDLATYTWRFVAAAVALAVLVAGLLWWTSGRSRVVVALWAGLVGLSWVAATFRYDLWPTAAALVGVLLVGRRPGLAGLALGVGTMLKLFPAALVPVLALRALVARDWGAIARLGLGFGLVVLLAGGWAWAIAGDESLRWLRYQEDRGLQLESLGASVLLGLHVLIGLPMDRNYEFGAVQVVAPGSAELVAISPWLEVAAVLVVMMLAAARFRSDQRRHGAVRLGSLALAAVVAITAPLLGSKVLSMQYILWALPLTPLLSSRVRWWAVLLAAMTTAVFTVDYPGLVRFETGPIALLIARNVVLTAFVGVCIAELWPGARDRTGTAPGAVARAG